ncbi:U3-containing 90S pre-ribosomal complex subunit-domain containing protein [Exophiala viscosa]|uniref:U3-containing 90S pre-ribosomal complex subunit-domain containing protein n=1 Tax=Exophiala viscosa TaxID=2486360 RepID=A0AAN6DS74_9EURO|nr:U3-containing 90S pre-ribosomal complex subunit-domain containing protein [Exophiala viscosa]KAI1623890.1 U3-containing 90S pre-ribosomal complex subunit-domain containing protein [Exophiala viscosa]
MERTKGRARKRGAAKRRIDDADLVDGERPAKRAASESVATQRQTSVDDTIALMDPALLADHFAKCIRKALPNSSAIELEESYLPTKSFHNTTTFEQPRTGPNLPAFLEHFSKIDKAKLSASEEKGSPHTIIVTSSGIRTADLTRDLRGLNTEKSKVAKLIAKHMKLKDNIEYMQKTNVGIAVGTPMRIKDLIDADAIRTDRIQMVVVDGSYRDEKKRTIFEMDDLFRPLMVLLNLDRLRQRYGAEGQADILVF